MRVFVGQKWVFSSNALGLCLDVSLLGPDCQKKLADLYPSLPLWPDHDAPISLECCSHLIVLTNHSETTHDSVRYWWTVGAKNCLPIFLNSTPVSTSYLVHGVTCLFIDSQDATWTKANQLIKTNYQALVPIASEARRRAYFKDSIQKNTSAVLQVLKNVSRAPCNFDKFLPL